MPTVSGVVKCPVPGSSSASCLPPGAAAWAGPLPTPQTLPAPPDPAAEPGGAVPSLRGLGLGVQPGERGSSGTPGAAALCRPPLPCTASPAAAVLPRAWTRRGVFWSGGANAGAVRGPGSSPGSGRLRCPPGREQPSAPRAGFCNLTRSGDTCCLSGTYVRGRPPRVSGEASPSPAARPRWPDPLPTQLRRQARGVREPARRLPSTHLPPRSGRCGGAVAGDGGVGWSPRPPLHPAQPSPRLSGVNPFRGCQHPGCAKGAVPGHCGDP